jgi:sulfur carrier protein ThiS
MDIIFNGVRERVPERTTISDLVVRTDEKDGGLIVEVKGGSFSPPTTERLSCRRAIR